MRATRPAAALALVLALSACAESPGVGSPSAAPSSTAAPSSDVAATEGLVLRVEHTGGYVTPSMLAARLPLVSVYADGRVITEGPVPAIYPGPALPNVQVAEIGPAQVQDLVDRALAAGVGEDGDLGSPPVADAPSTRFTLVTATDTHVREIYALGMSAGLPGAADAAGAGITAEQAAARAELSEFLASVTDPGRASEPYEPEAVAAVVSPWVDPEDGLTQPELPWPGPELPGEPVGGLGDVSCVTATGAEAQALLAAAREGNAATPWVTSDGMRWSVSFRPLLPDETGCADLLE
ncbi:hypothetical protein [Blastococcus tunisiensis]|uniref:Lipoprotein n=1 Tax=Blastococcus tunisiensis TaxID=1798228 RepID=A0A1I2CMB7_9ACTN|nr:hypothetical protein [Blastococcus sp. DSM 46838]SFE69451.1 hypothetical protein SAMN05216574_105121 [Blastococcus sp. DSM 46838]